MNLRTQWCMKLETLPLPYVMLVQMRTYIHGLPLPTAQAGWRLQLWFLHKTSPNAGLGSDTTSKKGMSCVITHHPDSR